jgi:hypothetical protein
VSGDATETVQLQVTLPPTAAAGLVETTIVTATSWTAAEAYDTVQDITIVNTTPGVVLTSSGSQSVSPDTVIAYIHTLTNTGNIPDTFVITHLSDQGWMIEHDTSITLNQGQTSTVVVSVTVPLGSGGLADVTVITATSQVDSAVWASVADTTTVSHIPGVVFTPDYTNSAAPGSVITYIHTLTNTGNGPDNFDLTYSSSQSWTVEYDTPFSVGYGQTATVVVSVTVPTGSGGLTDVTIVTATSQANHSIYAVVTDTTIVTGVCTPLQSVGISGPSTAISGTTITLNAVYTPTNATGVTILWDNNTTGNTSDYTWVEEGEQTVVVTATAACGDPVTSTHIVTVTAPKPHHIYLPLVLRSAGS